MINNRHLFAIYTLFLIIISGLGVYLAMNEMKSAFIATATLLIIVVLEAFNTFVFTKKRRNTNDNKVNRVNKED